MNIQATYIALVAALFLPVFIKAICKPAKSNGRTFGASIGESDVYARTRDLKKVSW